MTSQFPDSRFFGLQFNSQIPDFWGRYSLISDQICCFTPSYIIEEGGGGGKSGQGTQY